MIRINLLPVEKRKAERTPVPRFFMIIATAGIAAGIFFYIMYILLEINDVSTRIRDKQVRLEQLRPQVAEYERLNRQRQETVAKHGEIQSVLTRDIEGGYWRAANALWDVISNHNKVWIDDFKIMDARTAQGEMRRHFPDSKEAPPYAVTMRCHVAGSEVDEMTKFRNALKNNPTLLASLPTLNFNVDWKVDEERDYAERNSISFSVALFGSTEIAKKPAATAAPATGAPPAPPPGTPPVPAPPGGPGHAPPPVPPPPGGIR